VQRGTIVKEIELTGYIVAAKSQDLFFYSDGYVRTIAVKRGDKVTQGQVLATLDAKDLESQLAEAQLALKTSQAQVEAANQANADDLAGAQVEFRSFGPVAQATGEHRDRIVEVICHHQCLAILRHRHAGGAWRYGNTLVYRDSLAGGRLHHQAKPGDVVQGQLC
jgi:hypothetical protein